MEAHTDLEGDEFVVIIRKNEYNIIQDIASKIRNEMVKACNPKSQFKSFGYRNFVSRSSKCGTVGEGKYSKRTAGWS